MRITYCLPGTFNAGGMERIVINKMNWLVAHGFEVFLITTDQSNRTDFFKIDNRIKRYDLDIMYSQTTSLGVINKYIERRKLIKRHKKKLKRILYQIKSDIVISTFGNEVGFLPSFKDGSKKIAEIHFSRWFRLQMNRKGIWKIIDKYLTYTDYRILKKYDRFVCLTVEDKNNWSSLSNIDVIPNFVDFTNTEKSRLDSKSLIAVGRLCYQKGFDRLISAMKIVSEKHPDWILNIFGSGELKEDLKNQIEKEGLTDKINIHSPSKKIIEEYKRHSGLILSSRYEGLPMVLLEAMSVGLPLISFACQCGPKDVINQNVNGILVKEGDIKGLANAILMLIENPKLRQYMGENSMNESKLYNKNNIMLRWVNLFNSL